MEENVILCNIATIITKDILIDQSNNLRKPKHFLTSGCGNVGDSLKFPLLESDDEAFEFFLKQQQLLQKQKRKSEEKPSTSNQKPSKTHTKTSTNNVKPKLNSKSIHQPTAATTSDTLVDRHCIELNLLNEFKPAEFEGYMHMRKMTFLAIFQSVRRLLQRNPIQHSVIPPQTVFSLSLWKLTTDEHFEEIARKFHIPLNDCQLIIRQFWHMISDNYEYFIKWPNTPKAQQHTLEGFEKHSQLKHWPRLFGIVAIKRLDIFLENEDEDISIILQIICNADQKIIDCFVENAADYTFDASPIGQALIMTAETIPADCYLIGNKCFPLRKYLMRPIEMNDSNCCEQNAAFNDLLTPAFTLAQDVLDAMAKRFNTLYALEAKNLPEVRKIVETICALHNLCIDIEDDYVERKREVIKFNWANTIGDCGIGGEECDEQGLQRRSELMLAQLNK